MIQTASSGEKIGDSKRKVAGDGTYWLQVLSGNDIKLATQGGAAHKFLRSSGLLSFSASASACADNVECLWVA
jgi:hypothetical protein